MTTLFQPRGGGVLLLMLALSGCQGSHGKPSPPNGAPIELFHMTAVVDAEHDEIRISLQNLENVRRRYFLGRRAFNFSLRPAHGGDRPEVTGNELVSLMFDPSKTPELAGEDGFFDTD